MAGVKTMFAVGLNLVEQSLKYSVLGRVRAAAEGKND